MPFLLRKKRKKLKESVVERTFGSFLEHPVRTCKGINQYIHYVCIFILIPSLPILSRYYRNYPACRSFSIFLRTLTPPVSLRSCVTMTFSLLSVNRLYPVAFVS